LTRQQQVHTHDLYILNDFAVGHLCCASPEWILFFLNIQKIKSCSLSLEFELFFAPQIE
jgi:hypothetical protein